MASSFAAECLDPAGRRELLNDVVARCRRQVERSPAAVVFDLDGTLMDNRPRVIAIMRELADHWAGSHPQASALCRRVTVEAIGYGFAANLRALGLEDETLIEAGTQFWFERFFKDGYMKYDVEVPGAVAFARRCYEAGANLVYLTGRDLPNMAVGTYASLRDLGFPIGVVGTGLVTKPDFETPDVTFKEQVAPELRRLGKVIAAFDNEPGNCNRLLNAHPESTSVLIDTHHAPDPPDPLPAVRVIDSFEL